MYLTLTQLSQRRRTWRGWIPATTPPLPLLLHPTGHHPGRAPEAAPAASACWGVWSHSTSSSLFVHMLCFFPSIQRASPWEMQTQRVNRLSLSSPTPLLPLYYVSWETHLSDDLLCLSFPPHHLTEAHKRSLLGSAWSGSDLYLAFTKVNFLGFFSLSLIVRIFSSAVTAGIDMSVFQKAVSCRSNLCSSFQPRERDLPRLLLGSWKGPQH